MKTITGASIAALAFGLGLAATPVFAADYGQGRDRNDQPAAQQQDDQDGKGDKGNKGDKGDRHAGPRHDNNNQNQGGSKPSGMNKTDWQHNDNTNNNNNDNHANDNDRWRSHRNNTDYNDRNRNDNNNDNRYNNSNNNDHRFDNDFNRNHRNDWDRNRNRGNININIYRRNLTSPRRFRIGVYNAPRGYYYRRWHYGERLPVTFYARDYWLLDYIAFGLFAPPPGFIWVRYGPDALLIDEETGEIIQVRYDVFYS